MIKIVRESRIKSISFPVGSLTSDADGNFSNFADHAINGKIVKVAFKTGSYSDNGSIIVQTSGAGEVIWKYLNATANQTDYLHVTTVNPLRSGSATAATAQPLVGGYDGILQVWASGCGNAKNASGLTIFYI